MAKAKKSAVPPEVAESLKADDGVFSLDDKTDVKIDPEFMRSSYVTKMKLLLQQPFPAEQIKWLPKMVKGNRALAMAYIDARLVEDRLDDVFGPDGWEDEYTIVSDGSVVCKLTVHFVGLDPFSNTVSKCDVGSPSEQPDKGDRLKAAFSDALKRAAIKFGIGRYLYRIKGGWADYDPVKKCFVRPPQLPAWALPKAPVKDDKPAYEDDEPEPPVAAAVTNNGQSNGGPGDDTGRFDVPPAEKGTPRGAMKAAGKKLEADWVKEWTDKLTTCGTASDLNEMLPALKLVPEEFQKAVKTKVVELAGSVGWVFDKHSKKFVVDEAHPGEAF